MNKHRSVSKQEYPIYCMQRQLTPLTTFIHAEGTQSATGTPIHNKQKILHQVHVLNQPKIVTMHGRVEAHHAKENIISMGPYGLVPPHGAHPANAPIRQYVVRGADPRKDIVKSPITTKSQAVAQTKKTLQNEPLTDISNTMFSSAILPTNKPTVDAYAPRWTHCTPDVEPSNRQRLRQPVSSSFNLDLLARHVTEAQDNKESEEFGARIKQIDEANEKLKAMQRAIDQLTASKNIQMKKAQSENDPFPIKKSPSTMSMQDFGRLSKITADTDTDTDENKINQSLSKAAQPQKVVFKKITEPLYFRTSESALGSPRTTEEKQTNFKKKKVNSTEEPSPSGLKIWSTPTKPLTSIVRRPSCSQVNTANQPQLKLDDFQKGRLLGKGKFGEVYAVRHKTTGFVCAMKVISKKSISQDRLETQMTRQLKIISFIKHPNVVNCYGFFSDEENVYLLMELCSGGHLFKQIQERRRLDEAQTASIVKQVCQAVKYLHEKNIIHRDIKPENIILENGIAKLCDFGWSIFSGGMRKTVCGTPLYLSPQVIKGEEYDEKIDLWAIGILTYELLIGRIPFKIWSEAQLHKIVQDEVCFPDYIEVSYVAKDFILKILEKDPSRRLELEELLVHPFLSCQKAQPSIV